MFFSDIHSNYITSLCNKKDKYNKIKLLISVTTSPIELYIKNVLYFTTHLECQTMIS